MFYIDQPSVLAKRLIEVTQQALWIGINQVKPGCRLGDIGHAIQSHVESYNYSIVREYCGHGIGREFHEDPQVLHYGQPGTGIELQPGMCFTIEPMVNAFKERNSFITNALNAIPGVRCLLSEGAFYTFADTRQAIETLYNRKELENKNDISFSEYLLEKGGVAVVPGSAFGSEGYIRLSFATSMENLKKALERIAKLLN